MSTRAWVRTLLGISLLMTVAHLWSAAPGDRNSQSTSIDSPPWSPMPSKNPSYITSIESRSPASSGAQNPQSLTPLPFLARLISHCKTMQKMGHPELAARLRESLEEFEALLISNGPQARFSHSKIANHWLSHPEVGIKEITLLLESFEAEDFVSFRAELFQVLSLLRSAPGSADTLVTRQVATLAEEELVRQTRIPAETDLNDSVSPQLALTTISFRLLISTARSELEAVEIGKRHIQLQPNVQVKESMIATLLSRYPDADEFSPF